MTEAMFVLFDFEGHVQGLPTGDKVQHRGGSSKAKMELREG